MSGFAPAPTGQYQPTTSQSEYDCVPDVAADLVARATVDALRPTHADIRKASGVTGRGLFYSEAADAALKWARSKGWTVVLEPRFGLTRGAMRDIVASGRAVGCSIDTSVTRYTTRRTNYFVGGHTVYVGAYHWFPGGEVCRCEKKLSTAHAEFDVEDPGTTSVGYLRWSADLLYRAAEKRAGGRINLLVGPDTEGVEWIGRMKGRLRAEPDVDAEDMGPIEVDHVYPGGRTERGGPWKRGDGSTGYGWVHVQRRDGRWAWINGRRVKRA